MEIKNKFCKLALEGTKRQIKAGEWELAHGPNAQLARDVIKMADDMEKLLKSKGYIK